MKIQSKTITKLRELINEETEYRSGPKLVEFFSHLGFQDSYGAGFPSRWKYTEENLKSINGTSKMAECIKLVFSPLNFINDIGKLDKLIYDFNLFLSYDEYKISIDNNKIIINKYVNSTATRSNIVTEEEFITREFKNISLDNLRLDISVTEILKQRLEEIIKCLNAKAPLAVIFLCGSTLEGILLGLTGKYQQKFNQSKCAPKKDGKVLPFHDWTLSSLIDSARDIGLLEEDVKKHSHALRDFRNYIHPYQQMTSSFSPHDYTAKISWQVLQAAIYELSNYHP